MKPYIDCFRCGKPSNGWTYCDSCQVKKWIDEK